MECMTQEDGARGFVLLEVVGDGVPKFPRSLVGRHGEVEDVLGDRAVEPTADSTVFLVPGISAWIRRSAGDVTEEVELATHCLEEGRPLVVVGVRQIQCYGDVRIDKDRGVGVEEEGVG